MPGKQNNPLKFWQELKRRKVVRVIPVYCASAFVLLELIDIIAEPFGLPDWTLKLVVVILLVGLVISVILSWVYDITPDGVKKTGSATGVDKKIEETPAKTLNWKIISFISAIIIIGLLVMNILGISKNKKDLSEQEKSIAVLPFVNDSQDQENAYFINGIMEEILLNLQTIKDLRVPGRTSVEQYRNPTKSIPEIAKELGVNYIVEGSGQKYGNTIRLRIQLLDGRKDKHLWGVSYEQEIISTEDIFSMQSGIAKSIAAELKAIITPREEQLIDEASTSSLTAYDYYLHGKEILLIAYTQDDFQKAARFFQHAIEEDPEFASAYVGLAYTALSTRMYGSGPEIWQDSAWALNTKALALNPQLDEALYQRSTFYNLWGYHDKAREGFEEVLKINPNFGGAKIALGEYLMNEMETFEEGLQLTIDGLLLELDRKEPRFFLTWGALYLDIGEPEKAKKYYRQAIKLQPDSYQAYEGLYAISNQERNYEEQLINVKKMVEIERNPNSLDQLAWTYFRLANYAEAEKTWLELGELVSKFDDIFYAAPYKHRLAYIMWQTGRKDEAQKLFDEKISDNLNMINKGIHSNYGMYYDLAAVYAFLGEEEEAIKWFRSAADSGFFDVEFIMSDPLLEDFQRNPQFLELINNKINIQNTEKEKNFAELEIVKKRIRDLEGKGILNL